MDITQHKQDLLHELDRTRWVRLQRTQFVYWPPRAAPPRIEHPDGGQAYLQERTVLYRMKPTDDLLELLKEKELRLFETADDAVVYWRGWSLYEQPNDSLFAQAEYCMAHLWNDGVYQEARENEVVFNVSRNYKT